MQTSTSSGRGQQIRTSSRRSCTITSEVSQSKILSNCHRINEKKKRSSNARKLSNAQSTLLRQNQTLRSRRLVSVSTSFTTNSKEFEEIMRQKTDNRRIASRKNPTMNFLTREEDEGTIVSAIPIQETVSEDEDPEEEKIDTTTHRIKRTSSEVVGHGEM